MDIKRLALWEGRNATFMSNSSFSTVIEDQGNIIIELSANTPNGARITPLSLPYFRATGEGVQSDVNSEWWRGRQALYQAGGAYFSFPENRDDIITTTNTYWMLRRYGTENENHGVWRYSEMKSRELGNKYYAERVDLLIPGQNVLYTALRVTNTSDEEVLYGNPSWSSMLSYPLVESGAFINTNARFFSTYALSHRESGRNRYQAGKVYEDLKKVALVDGSFADASVVPTPTGTYDYLLGKVPTEDSVNWVSLTNPRSRMIYMVFSPRTESEDEYTLPNVSICQNYYGRTDAPWALFDGATPRVMAVTLGFNAGPKGTKNLTLGPRASKIFYFANAFQSYSNPRLGLGFYSADIAENGFLLRRTKSSAFLEADTTFSAIRRLSKRIFFLSGGKEESSRERS